MVSLVQCRRFVLAALFILISSTSLMKAQDFVAAVSDGPATAAAQMEKLDLLLAVGGLWELQDDQKAKPRIQSDEIDLIAHYIHRETKSQIHLYKFKEQFPALDLAVYNYETFHLNNCFYIESSAIEIEPIDESVSTQARQRMIPVCWNSKAKAWTWKLTEFIESENNEVFVAEYQSITAPDFRVFSTAKRLFTGQLGLCRPSNVRQCFKKIRARNIQVTKNEELKAVSHPRYYTVERSRAIDEVTQGSRGKAFNFGEFSISECQDAKNDKELINRVQRVVFNGVKLDAPRECDFDLTSKQPRYTCIPKKLGGLRMSYSFYKSKDSCQSARAKIIEEMGSQSSSVAGQEDSATSLN